jgi:hypothetical protein
LRGERRFEAGNKQEEGQEIRGAKHGGRELHVSLTRFEHLLPISSSAEHGASSSSNAQTLRSANASTGSSSHTAGRFVGALTRKIRQMSHGTLVAVIPFAAGSCASRLQLGTTLQS